MFNNYGMISYPNYITFLKERNREAVLLQLKVSLRNSFVNDGSLSSLGVVVWGYSGSPFLLWTQTSLYIARSTV